VACGVGRYSVAGASTCSSCAAGFYSGSTATSCQSCSAGFYSASSGASNCLSCNLGTLSTSGASKCIAQVSSLTCSSLGWTNAAVYGSPAVCGASNTGALSVCSGLISWNSAKTFCEDVGGRLCTLNELFADEARGTGCIYDSQLVWSTTSCAGGVIAAMGSTIGGSNTICSEVTSSHVVRCCGDV
jgi:hypothetical protein